MGIVALIAGIIALLEGDIQPANIIIGGLIICIPAGLFYYSFSNTKGPEPTVSTAPLESVPLKTSTNENSNKLDNLVKMTENRLFNLKSVFPFKLFPDSIVIEQKQVILICNQFFGSAQNYPILIKDILMPNIESSVFFATLKIKVVMGGVQQNPPSIRFLKKSEALKAARIITGLIICDREHIDLSGENQVEVVGKVEEIGRIKAN